MKKILICFFAFVLSFSVTACGKNCNDQNTNSNNNKDNYFSVINDVFWVDETLLGKTYDQINQLFGGNLDPIRFWEWDTIYNGYVEVEYNDNWYTLLFYDKILCAARYEIMGNFVKKSIRIAYKNKYGEEYVNSYDDGKVISQGQPGYGYIYKNSNLEISVFLNYYNDQNHITYNFAKLNEMPETPTEAPTEPRDDKADIIKFLEEYETAINTNNVNKLATLIFPDELITYPADISYEGMDEERHEKAQFILDRISLYYDSIKIKMTGLDAVDSSLLDDMNGNSGSSSEFAAGYNVHISIDTGNGFMPREDMILLKYKNTWLDATTLVENISNSKEMRDRDLLENIRSAFLAILANEKYSNLNGKITYYGSDINLAAPNLIQLNNNSDLYMQFFKDIADDIIDAQSLIFISEMKKDLSMEIEIKNKKVYITVYTSGNVKPLASHYYITIIRR